MSRFADEDMTGAGRNTMSARVVLDSTDCLQYGETGEDCGGEVELRPSLTGTGTAIPRCDRHWQARLDWQEEHERIYPDSDLPPEWFDPEAAGESWDEE